MCFKNLFLFGVAVFVLRGFSGGTDIENYFEWSSAVFHGSATAADRLPLARHGRYSNLEVYAHGLESPNAEDTVLRIAGTPGGHRIHVRMNPRAADMRWEIEQTQDLRNPDWSPWPAGPHSSVSMGDGMEELSVPAPETEEGTGFHRLRWTRLEPPRIRDALENDRGWTLLNSGSFAAASSDRLPTRGGWFFRHSVPFTWGHSAAYKDIGLIAREGMYLISFDAGHDGNNNRPFAADHITVGFFDSSTPVSAAGQVRDAVQAFRSLPGVSYRYLRNPAPLNSWEHWVLEVTVAPGSGAIGKPLSFGIHAQSAGTGGNQANFDNLLIRSPQLVEAGVARIRVDRLPRQTMIYGMDFERHWHFNEGGVEIDYDELAHWAVEQCRVSYVRIAVIGGAELEEGDIQWGVYNRQLAFMRAFERANPDIKWFASPRPVWSDLPTAWERNNAPFTCFPFWISVWHDPFNLLGERQFLYLDSVKGAQYYARFLHFMRSEGFEISYLDAINESTAHLKAGPVLDLVDELRRIQAEREEPMPLVIAPSAHNRAEANRWLLEAAGMGREKSWDITASHNTAEHGGLLEFTELARRSGQPVWNTEMHGFQGPDGQAVKNTEVLFAHIRAGYSGINDWLSLGNAAKEHKMFRNINGQLERMRIYYIFRQLVNTSNGGQYLHTDFTPGLTSTVAFLQEDAGLVTVWALNATGEPVNTWIDIPGYNCYPVEVRWWGADTGREGGLRTEGLGGDASLSYTVEADALYCFTFALKP